MIKRVILGAVVILVVAAFIIVWNPSISRIDPPAAGSFKQADVDHGKVLAGLGNCGTCHTANKQKPFAGGVSFPTPFGTLYSANITPDLDTGIGHWSEEAFVRAMREGVDREGEQLFPAFPYTHFTKVTDEDLHDLYAYLMTRDPVSQEKPANKLEFPFSLRPLQAGWKLLFFDDQRFEPNADKSDAWNRGAYIAEGLGHCTACHSPRNDFGAEKAGAAYDGALVDGWYAPALNTSHSTPVAWTEEELYQYLRNGGSELHGVAAGSMAEVVHQGLAEAPDSDIHALAVYFNDLSGAGGTDAAGARKTAATSIRDAKAAGQRQMGHGEQIYAAACASCHANDPDSPNLMRPELSLNSAITAPDPTNLLRVTLEGIDSPSGLDGVVMPAFHDALDDEDLVALADFLREKVDRPAWKNLQARIDELRQP